MAELDHAGKADACHILEIGGAVSSFSYSVEEDDEGVFHVSLGGVVGRFVLQEAYFFLV